jgi:anti-sigma factor RsiW
MNSNKCRQVRREIDELNVSQQPGEAAMAHLASCSGCAQFKLERANLRELVAGLEPVVAPADFDMRLRARIARERSEAERQPFLTRLIGMPAIAAAAVVVLMVGTVVWIAQRDAQQSTPLAAHSAPAPTAGPSGVETVKPDSTAIAAETGSKSGKEVVVSESKGPSRRSKSQARSPRSDDYGLTAANSIKANDTFVNSKPVVVSFEDDRGGKRKVSLPPVSFGAQSLVDNRVTPTYMGNSRVW